MITRHKRFFWILVACFGATLLPIFTLNLILLNETLGNYQKAMLASQWQQRTHGITYAPTMYDNQRFKTLRLNDRLAEINTVVLGSSTAHGIPQQAFPNALRIYNYAQSDHPLGDAINEATWLMTHTENVKYLVIPLDWPYSWLYMERYFSATKARAIKDAIKPPLLDRMRDALSYPRIVSLLEIFKTILRAKDRAAAFRGYLMQGSSDDYLCADGTWAKDFDITHRGICDGFRFDGSATFASQNPVKDAQPLITSAMAPGSLYTISLTKGQGRPNPAFLRRLADIARQAERKDGKLLLIIPPLLPGIEAAFLKHPVWSLPLMQLKQILGAWAEQENIVILDAGQSERFGCKAADFVDDHHALTACYDKIFAAFWSTHARTDGNEITWPRGGIY